MNALPRFLLASILAPLPVAAQRVTNAPPTDSAAQASPVAAPPRVGATDSSSQASPASGPVPRGGPHLLPGTSLRVRLSRSVDSGKLKNGQTIPATLLAPVRTSSGGALGTGTPVVVTVIATVPAGEITAMGEFSLEAIRVGSVDTETDIRTYRGQEGKRDVADAVPAVGTNAGLAAGAEMTFQVAGEPQPATAAPRADDRTPGSVSGKASGSAAPAQRSNSGEPRFGGGSNTKNGQPATAAAPANNSFQPAQNRGQASSAPNQAMPATNGGTAMQGQTTQAR